MNFNKFVASIQDIKMVENYSERVNHLYGIRFDDITHLSYKVLKNEIPHLIETGFLEEAIFLVLKSKKNNLTLKRVKKMDNYKKLKFLFWVQDQYKQIAELEARTLSMPPDRKLVAAGIQELDILGDTNLIDTLAGGNVLNWGKVMELPYSVIYEKQLKTVIESRITKKLNKIK